MWISQVVFIPFRLARFSHFVTHTGILFRTWKEELRLRSTKLKFNLVLLSSAVKQLEADGANGGSAWFGLVRFGLKPMEPIEPMTQADGADEADGTNGLYGLNWLKPFNNTKLNY
jgi:hypothetical protein